jgi:predicted Zn-dependent protease
MRRCWSMMLACSMTAVLACAKEQAVQAPVIVHSNPDSANDARLVESVLRVSSRLISAVRQLPDFQLHARDLHWVITVYDDQAQRRFVWPDGRVDVSVGAMGLAETEAGLAAILGHEFGHAVAHVLAPNDLRAGDATTHESPLFTFEEEREADKIGLTLMADAGYDPRELLWLWERMKRQHGHVADGLGMHLTYDRRMEHIAQWLPDALVRYQRSNRAPQRTLPLR